MSTEAWIVLAWYVVGIAGSLIAARLGLVRV